jgi:nucleoid DNA-binding protein
MANLSINKRMLWQYVNRKIDHAIHYYHIFGVITILFDEMVKDLKNGKKIKIFNFGLLELKEMKPRKYHDVNKHQVLMSKGHRILRFTLAPRISKKLRARLDLDKTLKGD